jgi:glycosyltransferase involved in cell wall biosynthesis
MDYSANIDGVTWFAKSVWPEIARQHPALHFQIVGRNPDAKIRSLASERVHVSGTVEDVRPFYASALAVVVPLRAGSGTRLKILEAMAAEVPVLSTRLGAEGIEAEHNVHLLLADSGREMVQGLRQLVASSDTRDRLSAAARSLVVKRYDWSSIGQKLCRIHSDLLGRPEDAFARTPS